MQKIYAGSLNIDASDDWMKFMPNCFKCLRASGDDLSVVEIIKIDGGGKELSDSDINVECLGNYYGHGTAFDGTVYDADGLSPTLVASNSHGNAPKFVEIEIIGKRGQEMNVENDMSVLGNLFGEDRGTGYAGNVWDSNGVCPTLTNMQGGGRQPHVVDCKSLRMVRTEEGKAIRKAYESGEVRHGFNEFREAEPREDGVSNTLTSVQKDNLVLQTERIICAMRGRESDNDKTEQTLEPQKDGVSNTLTGVQKDNLVLETDHIAYDDYNSAVCADQSVMPTLTTNCGASALRTGVKVIKSIKIRQATKDGYVLCELGGGSGFGISRFRDSKRQGDRERQDMSNADNGEYP